MDREAEQTTQREPSHRGRRRRWWQMWASRVSSLFAGDSFEARIVCRPLELTPHGLDPTHRLDGRGLLVRLRGDRLTPRLREVLFLCDIFNNAPARGGFKLARARLTLGLRLPTHAQAGPPR